jgi:hypothetical protein
MKGRLTTALSFISKQPVLRLKTTCFEIENNLFSKSLGNLKA